jgi:uncharacterized protein YegJ (DUF2314 family)
VTVELTKRAKMKARIMDQEWLIERQQMHTYGVVMASPKIDVNGIEDGQKGEAPRNAIDDDMFACGVKLVDDSSEQEEVNQRPMGWN